MQHAIPAYRLAKTAGAVQLQRGTVAPAALAPHEIRLRIHAASLNYRDLLPLRGSGDDLRDGLVPLSDGAGEVLEVGAAVTQWRIGDRVAPTFFRDWQAGPFKKQYLPSALGGGAADGVLSEHVVVPAHAVVAIPAHLSFAEAATLPCAAVTAWHALVERGGLGRGDTVLIQGTGGVALFALQIAHALGARAIVTSSSDLKLQRAAELGAWKTINYKTQPAWDQAVLDVTGGAGADHVLELGGPDTFERSIAALAAGGKIAQIGVLTGFGPTPNLLPIQFLNGQIHGICVGSGAHFSAMNRFLEAHQIKPVIDTEFDFEHVPQAYDYLASGQHFGKVVIHL